MEFAKYYDVSKIMNEMQIKEEINYYLTEDSKFEGMKGR